MMPAGSQVHPVQRLITLKLTKTDVIPRSPGRSAQAPLPGLKENTGPRLCLGIASGYSSCCRRIARWAPAKAAFDGTMSSRGSSIPRDLADTPSSPFLPVVPPSAAIRSRFVRRRPTDATNAASLGAGEATVVPFGEVGREHETDNFDVLSVLSGWSTDDADPESVPFQPQVRDLRMRRPNIRRRAPVPVAVPEEAAPEDAPEVGTENGEWAISMQRAPDSVDDDKEEQRRQGADQVAEEAREGQHGAEKEGMAPLGLDRPASPKNAEVSRLLCVFE